MGVGEILQHARAKFATEEGELNIDEDAYGNISIGGQELTFESWASLNKIKDSGVVYCAGYIPPSRPKRPVHSLPTEQPTTSPLARTEEPAAGNIRTKEPKQKKAKMPKQKAEKDEGEISESDEGQTSSASSSSEEESEDEAHKSRKRRKKRRQTERQTAPSSVSNMGSLLSKFYQYRFQIGQSLSLQQKTMFLDALKQSSSSASSLQQSQMMMQFMAAFMSSSLAQGSSSS